MADLPPTNGRDQRGPKRRLYTRLHRSLGVWSLAIVLVIALTGLILNHGGLLKLDERRVTSGVILRRYGVEPSGAPTAYEADGHLLALWDGQILFDNVVVRQAPEGVPMVGAGKVAAGEFVLVFDGFVFIVDAEGNLIDQLDAASLPAGPLTRAGAKDDTLVLATGEGIFSLEDWLDAAAYSGTAPAWFEPLTELSAAQRETLAAGLRGEGLPLSRVLLDLHSGRFFGLAGVIVYDLAALTLVVLGITGVQLWFRRR